MNNYLVLLKYSISLFFSAGSQEKSNFLEWIAHPKILGTYEWWNRPPSETCLRGSSQYGRMSRYHEIKYRLVDGLPYLYLVLRDFVFSFWQPGKAFYTSWPIFAFKHHVAFPKILKNANPQIFWTNGILITIFRIVLSNSWKFTTMVVWAQFYAMTTWNIEL